MKAFSDTLAKIQASAGDIKKELERVRLDRLRLIQERDTLSTAPVTDAEIAKRVSAVLGEAEERARRTVNMAPLYAPHGAGLVESLSKVGLSDALLANALGVFALLGLRNQIEPALIAEAKQARRGAPITEAERKERLAALSKKIKDLEVSEERLIRACEEVGISMLRRVDADPQIFLSEAV